MDHRAELRRDLRSLRRFGLRLAGVRLDDGRG